MKKFPLSLLALLLLTILGISYLFLHSENIEGRFMPTLDSEE